MKNSMFESDTGGNFTFTSGRVCVMSGTGKKFELRSGIFQLFGVSS